MYMYMYIYVYIFDISLNVFNAMDLKFLMTSLSITGLMLLFCPNPYIDWLCFCRFVLLFLLFARQIHKDIGTRRRRGLRILLL